MLNQVDWAGDHKCSGRDRLIIGFFCFRIVFEINAQNIAVGRDWEHIGHNVVLGSGNIDDARVVAHKKVGKRCEFVPCQRALDRQRGRQRIDDQTICSQTFFGADLCHFDKLKPGVSLRFSGR